jgi:cobalt-precorrin-5B (C1)-methyltransferase
MKLKQKLRIGFTTGSAAAAGAKAALLGLSGRNGIKSVDIPLPESGHLEIPIHKTELNGTTARAIVIKDGGDDPDVTHRARIISTVSINHTGSGPEVIIKGGPGVGRVTRPGLPVKVGEPAINPAPRVQITRAVKETMLETGLKGQVTVTIEVSNGQKIAEKTLNPRLGIIGGISILGTRGTVIPFSNAAYTDTIKLGLDVARAAGLKKIAFSTGGKSEKFLKIICPSMPEESFVQVGDFFAFSLTEVARKGFEEVCYACFLGKLIKMAQGHAWTHAHKSRINFDRLARWCMDCGIEQEKAREISGANTARHALEIIMGDEKSDQVFDHIIKKALSQARKFLGPGPRLIYFLFDPHGMLLAKQGCLKGGKN